MRAHTVDPFRPGIAGPAAGCWRLLPGRALSLQSRAASLLEIARGRVWLTLRGAPGFLPDDHVLHAGERLHIGAGQHVVLEVWHPPGVTDAVAFRWDGMAGVAGIATIGALVPGQCADSSAVMDWECGVLQPLRDLAQAFGQGGRAAGRLLVGITRWAWQRSAWCLAT